MSAFSEVVITRADGTRVVEPAYDHAQRAAILSGSRNDGKGNKMAHARRPGDGLVSSTQVAKAAKRSEEWVRQRASNLGGRKNERGHWRFDLRLALERIESLDDRESAVA